MGRSVNHDSASRGYPYRAGSRAIVSADHRRRIPVLDQGQVGSCTGNAGIGCLGTDPYYDTVKTWTALTNPTGGATLPVPATTRYTLDEAGAVQLYSDATAIDPWPGAYPPDDTGSDGLSVAKVLTARGMVVGYLHAFTLTDALAAVANRPVITGVNWYRSMFDPSPDGEVRVAAGSPVDGGHEFVVDGIDVDRGRVWATNSWGTGWGLAGRFWMSFATWGRLLGEDGDVTVFVPLSAPAPTPPPDPDRMFADVLHPWVGVRHIGGNEVAARAGRAWLHAKGL